MAQSSVTQQSHGLRDNSEGTVEIVYNTREDKDGLPTVELH